MKGYIYSDQSSLFGSREIIGFDGGSGLSVREIPRDTANDMIVRNHYSKKYYNATYIHLGIFSDAALMGVLQFGYAMNPASGGSVVTGTEMDQYLELNRMWVSDEMPRNSESMAISYAIRYIRGKYRRVKWIQSFADERCGGFGIVYQAANFDYYGEHTSDFYELDGEVFHKIQFTVTPKDKRYKSVAHLIARKDEATVHKLRQFRYIYWIDHKWRSRCTLKQVNAPKHYANG